MTPVKKILLACATVGAPVLVAASGAWACSAMPGDITMTRAAGAPGTLVEITGRGFRPRAGYPLMEVRWNSSSGRLLAVTEGESFTTGFYVPDDIPAQRFVEVVQRRPGGGIEGKVTVPFEVTAPAAPPPPAPQPDPAQPMVPEAPALTPAPTPRAPGSAAAPVLPKATQGAAPAPGSAQVVPGPGREPSTGGLPSVSPALVPSAAGASASVAGPKVEVSAPGKTVLVDVRDLWSGVEPGDPSASSTSLLAPSDSRSVSGSRLGVGLLALAAVGLLAGLALMVLSRRRAAVSASRSRLRSE